MPKASPSPTPATGRRQVFTQICPTETSNLCIMSTTCKPPRTAGDATLLPPPTRTRTAASNHLQHGRTARTNQADSRATATAPVAQIGPGWAQIGPALTPPSSTPVQPGAPRREPSAKAAGRRSPGLLLAEPPSRRLAGLGIEPPHAVAPPAPHRRCGSRRAPPLLHASPPSTGEHHRRLAPR